MLKALILLSAAFVAVSATPLLGAKQCTWGPSYWCSNITNAAGCNAVKHCIQTVWEHKQLEPDTDTVCQTCIKMVTEARDQLESNETQEEIKEVFEGSCKLIPIKIVNKECCKLADEFIPELIDTLASQMNPQVVCSVAGLCNNARVDKLIEEYKKTPQEETEVNTDVCQNCHTVVNIMEKKFDVMSKDQVLQSLLRVCGHFSSFSDACSNIVITYFTEIYSHLQENFKSDQVCLLAGECSAQFHVHTNVEVTPLSNIGFVQKKDDLPCDLCKQLVGHLRDLLVANTTELEFKKVMEGLCKQTGNFKTECVNLVDQYYDELYNFLVEQLNSSAVCIMTGVCPNTEGDTMIMPLLTSEAAEKVRKIQKDSSETSVKILQKPELMQLPIERLTPRFGDVYNNEVCMFCEYFLHYLQEAITNPKVVEQIKEKVDKACDHLPGTVNETCIAFVNTYGDAVVALLSQEIDPSIVCPLLRACPSKDANVEIFMEAAPEKPNCPLCLLAVTKLEETITDKKSEEGIKDALSKLCSHLSGNVKEECEDFVQTYTKELVEMMIADLTPQEVCVYLKLCTDKAPAPTLPPLASTVDPMYQFPITTTTEFPNEIFDDTANGQKIVKTKPECVMCEFAMDQLEHLLENKTTDDEIKNAVHGLCNHLPKSVKDPCNKFVTEYADLVIDLLAKSMKPSEICAEIHLCDPTKRASTIKSIQAVSTPVRSPQCTLCKVIMSQIEKLLDGKIDKKSVEDAIHNVCNVIPNTNMKNDCNSFIDKHGDQILDLLIAAAQPGEICSLMFFCSETIDLIRLEVKKCAVCEQVAVVIEKLLANPKIDHSIEHVLEKTCRALPSKEQPLCREMVDIYGPKLFELIGTELKDVHAVCHEVNLCAVAPRRPRSVPLPGSDQCTWGPGHWCKSVDNAKACKQLAYCKEKEWNGNDSPPSKQKRSTNEKPVLGAKKCTWGPSYWCSSLANANECNAVNHCLEKHWNGVKPSA